MRFRLIEKVGTAEYNRLLTQAHTTDHEIFGKKVKVNGREGVVDWVVTVHPHGTLARLAGDANVYYPIHDCKVIH